MKNTELKIEKVKVRFNVSMKNKKIPADAFIKAQEKYIATYKERFGTDFKPHPHLDNSIIMLLEDEYKEPFFFNMENVYEMPKEDADLYVNNSKDIIEDDQPRFFDGDKDPTLVKRYMKKFYDAEIVG